MRTERERAKGRYSTSAQMCFDSLQAKRNLSETPEMGAFSLHTQFHGPQIISDVCFSHMTVYSMYVCTVCVHDVCVWVCIPHCYGVRGRPYGVNSPSHLYRGYRNQTWVTRFAHYNVDLLSHLTGPNIFFSPNVLICVCLEENEVAECTVLPVDMVSASCSLLQCCLALLILLHSSSFLFAHCLPPCTPVTGTEWPVVNRALGLPVYNFKLF